MRMGRPTKLTPDVQTTVTLAIQSGTHVQAAATFPGIDKTTFYA